MNENRRMMNKKKCIEYLMKHDSHEHWEVPNGWENYDYKAADRRFMKLKSDIEKEFNCVCRYQSGSSIQDASYIGSIDMPDDILVEGADYSVLRVSHFGSMVTVFRRDKDTNDGISDDFRDKLMKVIEANEYVFIPCEVLYLEYPNDNWIVDWGHRFFDYL